MTLFASSRLDLILKYCVNLCTLGSITALSIVLVGCEGLKKSEEEILSDIFEEVPLGTSIDKVVHFLELHEYRIAWINYDSGFYDHDFRPPKVVGSKSLRAELGEYKNKFFFRTTVSVFFAFDEGDELTSAKVVKSTDAP